MNSSTAMLYELQRLVNDISLIERNHSIPGTNRHENDTEHSFALAMLCWWIIEEAGLDLNQAQVFKYALAHDFVERYAGDVNTFASDKERQDKIQREQEALLRLSDEFAAFPGMIQAMQGYEDKADEEALFVWTVDKMQALVLGDLDSWRPYKVLDISYQQFCKKYVELLEQASPHARMIFELVISHSQTTYYDQPKSPSSTGQQG